MAVPPKTYLIKSEPFKYAWSQLLEDKKTLWDGVRNYEARNHLRAMKRGDLCLFYHSNEGKEVVGVARVTKEAFPDATAPDEDWSVVEVEPAFPLTSPVSLADIKAEKSLQAIQMLTRPRLSVIPVTPAEFEILLRMGKTKWPKAKGASR